ncbi:MAG: tetratricopeptide repeat protein [Alphaproteobacteria bacterium]|jgi:tetratricopeptide (TPR) repeat protein|nr:MAG: tetratricopeptide repeat protein [Alphaproteobacteria bacterium]
MRVQGMSAGQADQLSTNGWALLRAGNIGGAMREFRGALAIEPEHVEALIGISQCHINRREFEAGDVVAATLLSVAPNVPQSHRLKSELLRLRGRRQEARKYSEEAVRLDPDDPVSYHFLAVVLFDQKKYAQALKVIEKGREVAPWYAVLAAQKALVLLESKGAKAAEPFADEALRMSPDDRYVLAVAGQVALMRGKLEKAHDLLGAVLRRDANDESALSYYLLTDPKRYGLLRTHVRFRYWRRDHGVFGWAVWLLVWCVLLAFIGVVAIAGRIPAIVVAVAYQFFWRAQYANHRKAVKAHFVQPKLNPAY